ncbi:MAG: hypothetical protein IPN76_08815 [Saprospiraceae bacterium]|nr:hypothetical protein [Saprospiraceae bacterium]
MEYKPNFTENYKPEQCFIMEVIQVGDINIALKYENKHDKVLFTLLGEALTEIQCFENCIYALLSGVQHSESKNSLIDFFEKNEKKTLGQLIYDLVDYIENEEMKNTLIEARDKRNFLVHKILRQYGWPLMGDKEYLKAFQEIVAIRNFIHVSQPILLNYIQDKKILEIYIAEFK